MRPDRRQDSRCTVTRCELSTNTITTACADLFKKARFIKTYMRPDRCQDSRCMVTRYGLSTKTIQPSAQISLRGIASPQCEHPSKMVWMIKPAPNWLKIPRPIHETVPRTWRFRVVRTNIHVQGSPPISGLARSNEISAPVD